ncbi:copper amine oxidase [Paenibacillus sp. CAA11]|uniref:phosphodiester glycosidase family protein n=1 Tax=Paenibacillus sp. CAA11 TaxID=1532905 RepID=UPI000D355D46|nr:phosphodiester glycosidase family protein [Paenibacillus sp. CAA11]AWB43959.1 copper amine oxidase [Paenibacillus sp. CAA11]
MSVWHNAGKLKVFALLLTVIVMLTAVDPGGVAVAAQPKIQNGVKKVKAAGRTFTVQTVHIPKGTPVTAGLAKGQVGKTESLAGIAKRYHAQAAINGTFFSAYGGPTDPYGTLILNGRTAYISRYGTVIGFLKDGTVLMDTLRMSLRGTVTATDGKSTGWYATWMNRTPEKTANTIVLLTPDRGANVGFSGGIAVTVKEGTVSSKSVNSNAAIPKNGYVIVFVGSEKKLADRFAVGSTVDYSLSYSDDKNRELPAWSNVVTALGAGPRLVKDSKVALNAKAEGFNDPKILSASATRSGIAIMQDGSIMLATVKGATMSQWAAIMKAMGAKQAMNLDGGASSGLYAGGKLLTSPGRLLSNALVFGAGVK